jgi:biotin transport system substrate-specific component
MQSALPSQSGLAHGAKSLQESIPGKAIIVIAASLFVAVCAHVSLPLPFTPVPVTLQTFAVFLVGMLLGPTAGFAAMMAYLAEGAAGLPVFSPHGPGGFAQLLGPTGGFLFSYPLAAAVAGWIVRGTPFVSSKFALAVTAGVFASAVVFSLGAGWLVLYAHKSASLAWQLGVAPFLPGDAFKILAGASVFSSLQRWARR